MTALPPWPRVAAATIALLMAVAAWAQPADPLDPGPVNPNPIAARLLADPGVVVGEDAAGVERWRIAFPEAAALVAVGDVVHVAVAHQVVALAAETGRVLGRTATSGRVVALESDGGGLRVTNSIEVGGERRRFDALLTGGVLTPPARFDPLGDFYDALAREADVPDPSARLSRDPTNPFLHLHAALAATDPAERADHAAAAKEAGTTFFDLAQLARAFADAELWAEADAAYAAATDDFLARGYDPRLLTDPSVHERYGFPLLPLEVALATGDDAAADLYARHLAPLAGPDLPGAGAALRAYAASLAARGERDEATAWRETAGALSNPSVSEALARNALIAGAGGTIASLALAVALLMQHLTLFAKYRHAVALARKQHAERGGRRARGWTLRSIRFYGTTEKLVLLALLATAYAAVALVAWAERGDVVVGVAGVGVSDTHAGETLWDAASGDPAAVAWVNGYRAAAAGDLEGARSALTAAPESVGESALTALSRGEGVPTPPPSVWRAAIAGTYLTAISDAFTTPWGLFGERLAMLGLPAWSWPLQLALFWVIVAWHVLWLPFPRPAFARSAPRPFWYEVLALAIPGSGQADELYGLLLLIPWSIFAIDAVMQANGAASVLGIPAAAGTSVLIVLYVFNTVAWGIEFASARRRLAHMKEEQPELARAFGLRLPRDGASRT